MDFRLKRAAILAAAGVLIAAETASARMNYRRLLKDLPAAEASERPLIIRAVGKSKRKRAMRTLLERFSDGSLPLEERTALAAALGDLGYREAQSRLVLEWGILLDKRFSRRSLSAEEEGFRAILAAAVAKTADPGNQEALAVLRRGIHDDNGAVARAAIEGLGRLKDAPSFPELEKLLNGDDAIRSRAAARALAGLGGADAERVLRQRLQSGSARARIDAALALGLMKRKIGILTLDGFLEEVEGPYSDGIAAAGGLAELGRTNGFSYLGSILQKPASAFKEEAIAALGSSGEARAILPLAALLDDSDAALRLRAVAALESIGGDRAAFELRRRRRDGAAAVRDAIRRARSRLGDYELP